MSNHTDMQDKYCGHTFTLFKAITKVAAVGRHHRRGAAAFGRGTSSVVSFVVAMNRVDVVELVVDLVDVNLDIDLVDVDLDVDLVDVDLVNILFVVLLMSLRGKFCEKYCFFVVCCKYCGPGKRSFS